MTHRTDVISAVPPELMLKNTRSLRCQHISSRVTPAYGSDTCMIAFPLPYKVHLSDPHHCQVSSLPDSLSVRNRFYLLDLWFVVIEYTYWKIMSTIFRYFQKVSCNHLIHVNALILSVSLMYSPYDRMKENNFQWLLLAQQKAFDQIDRHFHNAVHKQNDDRYKCRRFNEWLGIKLRN